jgi:ABC-type thiamine transport system substrate-binding protein
LEWDLVTVLVKVVEKVLAVNVEWVKVDTGIARISKYQLNKRNP